MDFSSYCYNFFCSSSHSLLSIYCQSFMNQKGPSVLFDEQDIEIYRKDRRNLSNIWEPSYCVLDESNSTWTSEQSSIFTSFEKGVDRSMLLWRLSVWDSTVYRQVWRSWSDSSKPILHIIILRLTETASSINIFLYIFYILCSKQAIKII